MKIVVIGAGSIFFTRRMVTGAAQSPRLRSCEIVLVDIDPLKCEQMGLFCQKIAEAHKAQIKVSWTTDRLEALPGADYVVLSFAIRNYHYRETGTNLAKTYGIHLISGETAGPSAVFRILRSVPPVLKVAADIERLCPNAIVINYVNPTNVVGLALQRFTKVRAYAFCDGMYEENPKQIARILGQTNPKTWAELARDFKFTFGGINHFTFMWGLEQGGKSLHEALGAGLARLAKEGGAGGELQGEWDFFRVYDVWPTQFYHAIEYMRYYQGRGSRPGRDHFCNKWSLNDRIRWYRQVWKSIKDCNDGKITVQQAMTDHSSDMVAAIIDSIEGDTRAEFPVNVLNKGIIPNLPGDILVETLGTIGKSGVEVKSVGPLPAGLAGLIQPSIESQELALEASRTGNFRTVVRAVAADPLVMSLNDAEDLARDFMAQEEADLDAVHDPYWWTPRR